MILRVPLKNIKQVLEMSRENNTRYSLQAVHFLWLTFCSSLYRENLHQQEVWLTDYFEGLWKPESKLSTLYRAFTDKQCTESKPMTVAGLFASDSSVSSVLFCWGQLFLCLFNYLTFEVTRHSTWDDAHFWFISVTFCVRYSTKISRLAITMCRY